MKKKIIRLPMGFGADKRFCQNLISGVKNGSTKKATNAVNSLEISQVGRLHEKGFSIPQIALKLTCTVTKVRYRLKIYLERKSENENNEKPPE